MTVLTTDRWFIYVSGFGCPYFFLDPAPRSKRSPTSTPYIVGWGGVYPLPIASVDSARLYKVPLFVESKNP